jgi:hypothetical protein
MMHDYDNSDDLVVPQVLVNATCGLIRSHLQRSFIAIEPFMCPIYETGKPWDIGCCLGYVVYTLPSDIAYIKNCEDILSRLGNSLSRVLYAPDDIRPYGLVSVVSDVEVTSAHPLTQAYFLEHCFKLDYCKSKFL